MSESHPESFHNYTRRCLLVFVAILCGIGLMVGCSFANVASPLRIAMVLAIACFNAGLVSCYLMHLMSERKFVCTVLIFTVIFFTGLMGLTMLAHSDVPHLKVN